MPVKGVVHSKEAYWSTCETDIPALPRHSEGEAAHYGKQEKCAGVLHRHHSLVARWWSCKPTRRGRIGELLPSRRRNSLLRIFVIEQKYFFHAFLGCIMFPGHPVRLLLSNMLQVNNNPCILVNIMQYGAHVALHSMLLSCVSSTCELYRTIHVHLALYT